MTANPLPERAAPDATPAGMTARPNEAAPPPEPAGGTPHRQLLRSSSNKVVGGVCGGLAEYTGTDPLLWRVAFIAFGIFGAGILVYALLWLLVPAPGPTDSSIAGVHETLRNGRAPRS